MIPLSWIKNGVACELNLDLEQKGEPLKVWGTGGRIVDPNGITPLFKNNYYYSFTNLHTKGTITIGSEKIEVTGITWTRHMNTASSLPASKAR
ncbi:lipocalin-like domain-containing protein [Flavobacterium sp. 3HN19-14]|uniref:lipocalin-like domain-containing protein n=1 Tax=Flavobacterium sp. 3HN19-14 TaxID=3448133 RepID=UPI003EDF5419